MKKIFKILGYTVTAVVFSIALSGCGKKQTVDPNAYKVIVWGFEDEDVWKPIIRTFATRNKGYSLEYKKQVFDGSYENKLLNSITSDGTPDVFAMPNDWVYRHKDKLYPMPETLAKTTDLDKQFVPAIKQSVYFDNQIYALSPSAEPLMVFYNPKIFDKASEEVYTMKDPDTRKRYSTLLQQVPSTWSDFTELAKFLTKRNGATIEQSGLAMGTSKVSNATDILYLLMLQNETEIISSDLRIATFNLPKSTSTGTNDVPGKRAVEFYTSFANPNSSNYTWNDSIGDDLTAFGSGKVAMIFGYSDLQNTLLQKYPSFQYRKAFVPQLQVDSTKIIDYAVFNAFGVNKFSKNPAAAWNLVNQLATDSNDDFVSGAKLYTSKKAPSYTVSITERISSNPEKLELATAKSLVKGRYPSEFDYYMRGAIEAINRGTQNPSVALDLTSTTITEMLRKQGW